MESFAHSHTDGWTYDDRLQGEQNLKMTIQQYIEGLFNPVCPKYRVLDFKLKFA
jgi:hypothetical protein